MERSFKEENELINRLSFNMEESIRQCIECSRITASCLQHCLSRGGFYAETIHINLLLECSAISHLTSNFMLSSSIFSHELSGFCAKICDACANSCHDIDPGDPLMRECENVCRACAEACRNMEH